jgi:hypothetical protein
MTKENLAWKNWQETKPENRKCRMCGARLSPFMGKECWEKMLCQNCIVIKQMESSGALARAGLMTTDMM